MLDSVSDFLLERIKADPKVQAVAEDVLMYDDLREHVGWRRLYEKVRADRDRFLLSLAKRLMSGDKVSDEEIAYMRGFYAGAEWVVSHPEYAVVSLEKAASRAATLAQLDLLRQEDEAAYG